MKTYRIAAIPGDGIGTEVIPAGIELLSRAADGFRLEFEHFDWSSQRFQQTGQYIPQGGLERLKAFDAIFFGAVGAPEVPDHLSLWGLRLPICQGFDQYANVRPSRVLPGVSSQLKNADAIDWVIVRENTEGEYSGSGGRVHKGLPEELATETSIFTRKGVANPITTFWTASMMLEHLGEATAAARLMRAIEAVTAKKFFTPDLGGTARTRDVTEAVKAAL